MSNRALAGFVLLFLTFSGLVIYGNYSLTNLDHLLDLTEQARDECLAEKGETERELRHAKGDRDRAIDRAEDAEKLMRSSAAQASEEAFAKLRAQDATKALQSETARLKASIANLKAAAIETGSIGKPAAAKAAPAKPRKPSPPAVRKAAPRDDIHEWFLWTMPRP